MIDNEESGVFSPQNAEYTNTSDMVQMIATIKNHNIIMIPGFKQVIKLLTKMNNKVGQLSSKAFGDSYYDMGMSTYKDKYQVNSLLESIKLTEREW